MFTCNTMNLSNVPWLTVKTFFYQTFLFLLYLSFFTIVKNITVIQLQILQILGVYFTKKIKQLCTLINGLVIKIKKHGIIILY